jgi:uncharacterized protein
MRKFFVAALCIVCTAGAAWAQEPAANSMPTHQQVMRLLELTHARDQMKLTMANFTTQVKQGAREGFKSKVPNATEQQLRALDSVWDDSFSDIPYDEMLEAMIPIYQRHLTKSDVDGLIAFYSSPLGAKVLRELPAITTEAMQASGAIMQKRLPEIMKRMDARMQQMVEANHGSNGTSK